MRSFRWHMIVLLLLLATASFAAQHNAGVILLPPAGTYTPQLSGLSDAILNAVAALDAWNVLLLHPDSPLLNDEETTKLFTAATTPPYQIDALPKIAAALDLDDIFLIRIAITEGEANAEKPHLATLWAAIGQTDVHTFDVEMTGLTLKNSRKTAEDFAARIAGGFESVPACTVVAMPATPDNPPAIAPITDDPQPDTTPTPAVATPAPANPDEPAATPPIIPAVTQPDTPEPAAPPVTDVPAQADTPVSAPAIPPVPATGQPTAGTPHTDAARKSISDGNLDMARREIDIALQAGEPMLELYLVRADLARMQGDEMGRRKALESAARIGPDRVEPLLQLAALFRSQGLWQKAFKTYDQAIEIDEACIAAYTSAAALYMSRQMPRQAAEYLETAITHDLGNVSLLIKLGDAYRAAEDMPKAEETYELAIRGASQRDRSLIFDKLGDMYVEGGCHEEGFNSYVEASRLRDESDRKYARERYRHIMQTADEAVISNLNICTDLFDAYTANRNVPREKVYIAAEHATAQMQKVIDFADSITAPDDLISLHLRRQVAYSLAFEAAVNLMTHIDTNLDEPLVIYHRAVSETAAEFAVLRQARSR